MSVLFGRKTHSITLISAINFEIQEFWQGKCRANSDAKNTHIEVSRVYAMLIVMANKTITISQAVAILIDGNNIERSIHSECGDNNAMLNFDTLIPNLLDNRALNRLIYFREGKNISEKLAERLYSNYHGSVQPCHKSADIPLSIKAMQLASKIDTIIIMSGDADYVELVRHLKSEGVRVEIAAVPATTSAILVEAADFYHEITEADWFVYTTPKRKSTTKKTTRRKKRSE